MGLDSDRMVKQFSPLFCDNLGQGPSRALSWKPFEDKTLYLLD